MKIGKGIPDEFAKDILEAMTRYNIIEDILGDSIFFQFNRSVANDLKTKHSGRPGWKTLNETAREHIYGFHGVDKDTSMDYIANCNKCGNPFTLHIKGKCPTIIDGVATDVEDKPLLQSGKEGNE